MEKNFDFDMYKYCGGYLYLLEHNGKSLEIIVTNNEILEFKSSNTEIDFELYPRTHSILSILNATECMSKNQQTIVLYLIKTKKITNVFDYSTADNFFITMLLQHLLNDGGRFVSASTQPIKEYVPNKDNCDNCNAKDCPFRIIDKNQVN